MKTAVIYARVSSKDQEREGFSIPAQLKLLFEYAAKNNFRVVQKFVDVETAKATGRKQFGAMVQFLQQHPECRVVLVEKTDRLYRNFHDAIKLQDLDVEIHLVKEGQTVSKDSKSQDKLIHDVHLVLARHYVENLKEEVRKGMREKAAQGVYPGRPPLGYRNDVVSRTIVVNAERAPIAQRMFEIYASGRHSLASLRATIFEEFGVKIVKSHLEKLLKNPFYCGLFVWQGQTYRGSHTPLVSNDLFQAVQTVFRGHNHSKYRKHEFAFGGLLRCAYDDCAVTAERKKGRYVYYRCTGHRGPCDLPRFREADLSLRLGALLRDIHVPDDVLAGLQQAFKEDQSRTETWRTQERERLEKRLASVRSRMDQTYLDKLDGKISEHFWQRKTEEWQQEEQQVLLALGATEQVNPDRALTACRILELANKAHSLYVRQNPTEQAKLLKMVLLNCSMDTASLYPTYRKPFEMIFQRAKTKEWSGREDLNLRPPGPEPDAKAC